MFGFLTEALLNSLAVQFEEQIISLFFFLIRKGPQV